LQSALSLHEKKTIAWFCQQINPSLLLLQDTEAVFRVRTARNQIVEISCG
jgi:non-ribosomal peptide synthetase component E (peptide arylation enzyme)